MRRKRPSRNGMVTVCALARECSTLHDLGARRADAAAAVGRRLLTPAPSGISAVWVVSDHLQRLQTRCLTNAAADKGLICDGFAITPKMTPLRLS